MTWGTERGALVASHNEYDLSNASPMEADGNTGHQRASKCFVRVFYIIETAFCMLT